MLLNNFQRSHADILHVFQLCRGMSMAMEPLTEAKKLYASVTVPPASVRIPSKWSLVSNVTSVTSIR